MGEAKIFSSPSTLYPVSTCGSGLNNFGFNFFLGLSSMAECIYV